MRLRTVAMDGGRVGWKRAFLREAVFLLPILIVSGVVSALVADQQGSSTGILWMQLPTLFWLGLGLSMRSTNGFRGVHELASGTRVIPIPEESLVHRTRVPIVVAHQSDDIPDTLGPYSVRGAMGWCGGNRVLLGRDETLDRGIWLFCRDSAAPTPSTSRTEVSRPTRLRWLQSGSAETTSWDAYEAIQGIAFEQALEHSRFGGWDRGRHAIRELAAEMLAADADQTLPDAIHPDQVWLTREGHVKLLDDVLVADPESVPDESQRLSPQKLIRRFTSTCSADQMLPGHARQFVDGLADKADSDDLLEWVTDELTKSRDKPMQITWRDRVGMIGVALAIDGLPLILMIHVASLLITSGYSTHGEKMGVVWWAIVPSIVLAAILGTITRGGLAFRVMNVEIQTTAGQSASRYRCAQRHLVAWATWILFIAAGATMMVNSAGVMEAAEAGASMAEIGDMQWREGGLSYGVLMGCMVFLPPLLFAGAIWTVLNPRRGPHDLMTGTQLVPR